MGNKTHKTCSICGTRKDISEYYKNRKGYYSYCKSCTNLKSRNWTRNNSVKISANRRKYYLANKSKLQKRGIVYKEEIRKKVLDYYGNKCVCCGEPIYEFLTIDHKDNDGNVHLMPNGRRYSGLHFYRTIIKEGFPDKYQILCHNCNWGKHVNNGICPHQK